MSSIILCANGAGDRRLSSRTINWLCWHSGFRVRLSLAPRTSPLAESQAEEERPFTIYDTYTGEEFNGGKITSFGADEHQFASLTLTHKATDSLTFFTTPTVERYKTTLIGEDDIFYLDLGVTFEKDFTEDSKGYHDFGQLRVQPYRALFADRYGISIDQDRLHMHYDFMQGYDRYGAEYDVFRTQDNDRRA